MYRTVRTVAEQYGVSTAFVIQALAKIGFKAATPDTELHAPTVHRFEKVYGDKIREARPGGPPPPRRGPRPHVIRVAHERFDGKRDMRTLIRFKVLADDPGSVHAIDAAGTREGDPWRGQPAPGEHSFYEHQGPHAACGVQVKAVLGDVFDSERPDACPTCAELVSAGKAYRTPPHERESRWCEAYLRRDEDGRVTVEECRLRNFHDGRHRTSEGATWEKGVEDYAPAPDN